MHRRGRSPPAAGSRGDGNPRSGSTSIPSCKRGASEGVTLGGRSENMLKSFFPNGMKAPVGPSDAPPGPGAGWTLRPRVLWRGRRRPSKVTVDTAEPALLDSSVMRVGSRPPGAVPVLLASIVLASLPSCRPGQHEGGLVSAGKLAPGEPGIGRSGETSEDAIERAEAVRRAIDTGVEPVRAALDGLNDADALVRGTTITLLLSAETALVRQVVVEFQRDHGALFAPDRPAELRLLACELAARDELADLLDRPAFCRTAPADADPQVRSRAVAWCAGAGLMSASRLEAAAGDASWIVRTRLASSLADHAGVPGACAVVERLVRDEHPTVRTAARQAARSCPPGTE